MNARLEVTRRVAAAATAITAAFVVVPQAYAWDYNNQQDQQQRQQQQQQRQQQNSSNNNDNAATSNATGGNSGSDTTIRVLGIPSANPTNLPSFGTAVPCMEFEGRSYGGISFGAIAIGGSISLGGSVDSHTDQKCQDKLNETAKAIAGITATGAIGSVNGPIPCEMRAMALKSVMGVGDKDFTAFINQVCPPPPQTVSVRQKRVTYPHKKPDCVEHPAIPAKSCPKPDGGAASPPPPRPQ